MTSVGTARAPAPSGRARVWTRVLIAVAVLVVLGVGYAAWALTDHPPAALLLRHGLTPGCEPTGETKTLEGVRFIEIGPGIFRMGATSPADGALLGWLLERRGITQDMLPVPLDERPPRWVEFAHGFWLARTEVTNAQYERFDPEHARGETSPGDDDPVVGVSWAEARRYCKWLAEKSGLPVRLPSEAEWECACRAGSETDFGFGDDATRIEEFAWIRDELADSNHEVATRKPNRWGFHDLHGNACEWCEDTWHPSYAGAPTDGSAWVDDGSPWRVYRGGDGVGQRVGDEPTTHGTIGIGGGVLGWGHRSAARHRERAELRFSNLGFRPALSASRD